MFAQRAYRDEADIELNDTFWRCRITPGWTVASFLCHGPNKARCSTGDAVERGVLVPLHAVPEPDEMHGFAGWLPEIIRLDPNGCPILSMDEWA